MNKDTVYTHQWISGYHKGRARVRQREYLYGYYNQKVWLRDTWGLIDESSKFVSPCQWEYLSSYYYGMYKVKLDGKWGFIDRDGNVVCECQWNELGVFRKGLAPARKGMHYYLIDRTGNPVISLPYRDVKPFYKGFAPVNTRCWWGIMDADGNLVVRPQWYTLTHFNNGLYKVSDGSKWGIIDYTGSEVYPCELDEIGRLKNGLAPVRSGNLHGSMDRRGNVFYSLHSFGKPGDYPRMVRKNGKWGLVDPDGNVILPFCMDKIEQLENGRALIQHNGKYGFIDDSGKIVVSPVWDNVVKLDARSHMYWHWNLAIVKQNEKYGLIDIEGNIKTPCQWDYLSERFRLFVVRRNGKFGAFDHTGAEIIPCCMDNILPFGQDLIQVKQDGKFRILDRSGIPIHMHPFDEIRESVWKAILSEVRQNGKWSLLDSSGVPLYPFQWDSIEAITNFEMIEEDFANPDYSITLTHIFLYKVEKDGKFGLIAPDGTEVTPTRWDDCQIVIENRMIIVRLGKKLGLMDAKGNLILPCEYDVIDRFSFWDFRVRKDGKYGIVSRNGKTVLQPLQWDWIEPTPPHFSWSTLFSAEKDGKLFWLASFGKLFVPNPQRPYYAFAIRHGKYGLINEKTGEVIHACTETKERILEIEKRMPRQI